MKQWADSLCTKPVRKNAEPMMPKFYREDYRGNRHISQAPRNVIDNTGAQISIPASDPG